MFGIKNDEYGSARAMDLNTVFTKTSKGAMEVSGKSRELSREQSRILTLVDGRSTLADILDKAGRMSQNKLEQVLGALSSLGYIRVLKESGHTQLAEELGFSSTIIVDEANTEMFFEAQAAHERRAREEAKKRETSKEKEREALMGELRAEREAEARTKAAAEAAAKAKAEADAKTKREAEQKAAEEARQASIRKAQAEAEERARRDAELKAKTEAERRAREEAERKARLEAETKAKAEAERKAREEAEQKAAAERKARTEAEARARKELEAKVRLEAEAKETARKEAEAKAKAQTEAQARAEAEARMREAEAARRQAEEEKQALERQLQEAKLAMELEARVKRRLEARAREEEEGRQRAEAKAREEAEARARTEQRMREEAAAREKAAAEAKAREEAERRAREEAERRAREEAEARAAAEAKARAEAEQKMREEAAAREQAAAEAKAREEAEAKQREEAERRAREEAVQRAHIEEEAGRVEAEIRLAAERAEREEAEARARAEAEKVEAERRTRELVEERARAEAEASAREEERTRAKALAEEHARQETEEARRRAEEQERFLLDEEVQERQEAELRAQAVAEALTQEEEALDRILRGGRARSKINISKLLRVGSVGLVGALLLALLLVHVISFNFYAPKVEAQLSTAVGERVSIGKLGFSAFPAPHWKMEQITFGALNEIRIARAEVQPGLSDWFSDEKSIQRVSLEGIAIDRDGLLKLPLWLERQAKSPVKFTRIEITQAKLEGVGMELPAFGGHVDLGKGGAVGRAVLTTSDQRATVELDPKPEGVKVHLRAQTWAPPLGVNLQFDELEVQGVVRKQSLEMSSIYGTLYGGTLKGSGRVSWADSWTAGADLELKRIGLAPVVPLFTDAIRVEGELEAKASIRSESTSMAGLLAAPEVRATFLAREGLLGNVDLVRAINAPAKSVVSGGQTRFGEFSGYLQLAKSKYQYRQLRLVLGVLSATGTADIEADKTLTGNVASELKSKATTIRVPLSISGTLATPSLRGTAPPATAAKAKAADAAAVEQP